MSTWTSDELDKIGSANELQISTERRDGTFWKRIIIWVVRVENDIYIRSYNGSDGSWYRRALATHKARIWSDGVEKNVSLSEISDSRINDRIDLVYKSKYGRYSTYVAPMVTDKVRETTLKLEPVDN